MTNTVTPSVSEIVLRPWQVDWAHRALQILRRNHGYIDTSQMGSGKTFVALWLAKHFGFAVIIVCPVIMIDIWREVAQEYGVEVIDIIGFPSLRSQQGCQPKCGLLYRHDDFTEGGIHHVIFTPTETYLSLVRNGIFLICDEAHFAKNDSAQRKALCALIRPIIMQGGRSRFGLLSGTPFDQEEHAVNLLRMIGYIRSHRLYGINRETGKIVLEGIQELIDACRFINANETNRILADIPRTKKKMTLLCYTLYVKVIKAYIAGAMPDPVIEGSSFDVKNGHYAMSESQTRELQLRIENLARAARFDDRTGRAEFRGENIGLVKPALVAIENAKIFDFARVATAILLTDFQSKVILSVNYTSTIEGLQELLTDFNPLVLNGKTPVSKRKGIVEQFNTNPESRLLIMNTAVGGTGIGLHDTVGDSPRYMLISPSYKLIEIIQAIFRIWRAGSRSNAVVRLFYGRGTGAREAQIHQALARKGRVLEGGRADVEGSNLLLPGNFENEVEVD